MLTLYQAIGIITGFVTVVCFLLGIPMSVILLMISSGQDNAQLL